MKAKQDHQRKEQKWAREKRAESDRQEAEIQIEPEVADEGRAEIGVDPEYNESAGKRDGP